MTLVDAVGTVCAVKTFFRTKSDAARLADTSESNRKRTSCGAVSNRYSEARTRGSPASSRRDSSSSQNV
jgi:hypothetical protein